MHFRVVFIICVNLSVTCDRFHYTNAQQRYMNTASSICSYMQMMYYLCLSRPYVFRTIKHRKKVIKLTRHIPD